MPYAQRFLRLLLFATLGVMAFAVALVPVAKEIGHAGKGDAEPLDLSLLAQNSLVFDKTGSLLYTSHAEENRTPITLDAVPATVRDSILVVEDENFYSHSGVNLRATLRALLANVQEGGVDQGGSTITMQLVKNALLTPERSLARKAREAVLAARLETQMTKDEILERYLNTVYFGNGAYGVQAAARVYYGKDVGQLGWAEGAMLAALIRFPDGYDPFRYPEIAVQRRRIALQRLVETGHITQAEADVDSFTPLPTQRSSVNEPPRDYFVETVIQQMLNDPSYNLGSDPIDRSNAVFKGGLRVYTTLDPAMQLQALSARNDTLPDHDPNGLFAIKGAGNVNIDEKCPKLNDGAGHCKGTVAMVSVEPSTGAVREVVGGPGFDSWKFDLTQARQQPGSAMKPYVLVTALEQGNTINDSIDGGDCSFVNKGGTPNPYNVKGEGGVASLVTNLAGSINCAFLRLGQVVGTDNVVAQAQKMGVESPLSSTLSLPLGTSTITPLEMAAAYASIANDGVYNPPYFIEKITDANGKVIYEHQDASHRAMSTSSSRQAIVAMKAVVTGGTATKARLADRPAAGKTGTTEKHGDAWFVGFTPQLATAVWMGSPEADIPMNSVGGINVFGGTFPALVWHNFMTAAMEGQPVIDFTPPGPLRGGKQLKTAKGVENIVSTTTTSTQPVAPAPTVAPPTVPEPVVPPIPPIVVPEPPEIKPPDVPDPPHPPNN